MNWKPSSAFGSIVVASFLVVACGTAPKKASTVTSNSLTPAPSCTQNLQVSSQIVTAAPLVVNSPVRIKVTASFCSDYQFAIVGVANGQRFSSELFIDKSYPNAGSFTEAFTVLAYQVSNPSLVAAVQVATQQLTITAPANSSPPPTSAPTCAIVRDNTSPVTMLNAPIRITVNAIGNYTTLILNNAPVVAGVAVNLNPVVADSGFYLAQATIVGPGGATTCALSVQVPTCSHEILSAVLAPDSFKVVLNTRTNINGVVNYVEIDEVPVPAGQFPAAPNRNLDFINPNIVPIAGPRISEAFVANSIGDSATCTAGYSHEVNINVAKGTQRLYAWNAGIQTSGALNAVMTEAGAGNNDGTGRWKLTDGIAAYSVLDSNYPTYDRYVDCNLDEIMVGRVVWTGAGNDSGRAEAMKTIVCRRLRPELQVVDVTSHTITWGWGVNNSCPTGKVLVGNLYAASGAFTIKCGRIRIK